MHTWDDLYCFFTQNKHYDMILSNLSLSLSLSSTKKTISSPVLTHRLYTWHDFVLTFCAL